MRLPMFYRWWAVGLVLLTISGCSSCGDDSADTKMPMTPLTDTEWKLENEKLQQKRMAVETLFLTEDGQEVIGTAQDRAVIDPQTGKIAWEAWQCDNPKCPRRKANGDPFLFPWPDPLSSIKDGEIATRLVETEEDIRLQEEYGEQKCPACLEDRDLATESSELRQQYKNWCRPHLTPNAVKRIKELDQQRRRLYKRNRMLKRKRKRPAQPKAKKVTTAPRHRGNYQRGESRRMLAPAPAPGCPTFSRGFV